MPHQKKQYMVRRAMSGYAGGTYRLVVCVPACFESQRIVWNKLLNAKC